MRADSRFQKAVEYQLKNPNLTVCDAMKLADFSLWEQEDKAKHIMILRLLNKTMKDDFVTPPAISSVTMSAADSSVTSAPAKKAKIICSTATAMLMRCREALEKKKEFNTAFKRATVVYVREKGKDDGMSARIVADLIRNDCGISLCPRTIQKKVKAGEIRYSPLRRGPKEEHPGAALQEPLCCI